MPPEAAQLWVAWKERWNEERRAAQLKPGKERAVALEETEKKWQEAVTDATSAVTLENQKLPQNQWQIHPLIDGCQPVIIV